MQIDLKQHNTMEHICCICRDMDDVFPVNCSKTHMICRGCMESWFFHHTQPGNCPFCNEVITEYADIPILV